MPGSSILLKYFLSTALLFHFINGYIPPYSKCNAWGKKHQFSLRVQYSDRTSAIINGLINKTIQLGSSLAKGISKTDQDTTSAPVSISFSASQNIKISLQNETAAYLYLAIPPSNYSVLDSNLISRKANEEDVFTMSLSLADITAAMGPSMYLPALLTMDISVDTSSVSEGRLSMQSSPMLLSPVKAMQSPQPIQVAVIVEDKSTPADDTPNPSPPSFDLALPSWILLNSSMALANKDTPIESPVQSAVQIQLKWPPRGATRLSPHVEEETELLLNAFVMLKFSAVLSISSDVARVLNFPPMKLLIQQICSLTAKSVLSAVAPSLSKLLVQDFDRRKASL